MASRSGLMITIMVVADLQVAYPVSAYVYLWCDLCEFQGLLTLEMV